MSAGYGRVDPRWIGPWLIPLMRQPLRTTFAAWCRGLRIDLDITQRELADAVGVSRSLIASFETGRRVPDLDMVDRIATVLGVDVWLDSRRPIVAGGPRERDLLHARCSGYGHRRMTSHGHDTLREVEVIETGMRGWIDLLAFDHRTGTLLIIEIKTELDDLGAIERQLGRYERLARQVARDHGWAVRSVQTWVLLLATTDNDAAVTRQRDLLDLAFPIRAAAMERALAGDPVPGGRGLALIDPARRRRSWLIPCRIDGRRTIAPYRDRADALRHLS